MHGNCWSDTRWPREPRHRARGNLMDPHRDFPAQFMRAVDRWRDGEAPEPFAAVALNVPAFAVYANTGLRACIAALEAAYPSVRDWIGKARFETLATGFARTHPPADSRLFLYGEGFADHLLATESQGDWPFLADLARIDRCRTEAHAAFDARVLGAAELAQRPPEALARTVLVPAPATRWHHSTASPVLALWTMARQRDIAPQSIPWRGQAVLITRPDDEILMHELPLAGIALLEACARRRPLAEAAAAAQDSEPDIDLQLLFATLFTQGAFRSLAPDQDPSTPNPEESP